MAVTAATGFFDGVHLGHRKVLEKVCSIANEKGEESVVITFWPHPSLVLGRGDIHLLTSLEEKKNLILDCGISRVEVVPFTKETASMSAENFIQKYLIEKFDVSTLVLGFDHRFGHDKFESVEELAEIVRSYGLKAETVGQFLLEDGMPVSSTSIRQAISSGNVELASRLLGRAVR